MQVKITAKALAEFAVGGPAKKAQIVRTIKKPQSTEAKVITHYYSPAVNIIRVYHASNNDYTYLAKQLKKLSDEIPGATCNQTASKIRNNIRVIEAYIDLYGTFSRTIIPRPRIAYLNGDVRVSASPDMAILENGKTVLMKLGPTKKPLHPFAIQIILQLMSLAARTNTNLSPYDVIYLDVASSTTVAGQTHDETLTDPIDKACLTLASMCAA